MASLAMENQWIQFFGANERTKFLQERITTLETEFSIEMKRFCEEQQASLSAQASCTTIRENLEDIQRKLAFEENERDRHCQSAARISDNMARIKKDVEGRLIELQNAKSEQEKVAKEIGAHIAVLTQFTRNLQAQQQSPDPVHPYAQGEAFVPVAFDNVSVASQPPTNMKDLLDRLQQMNQQRPVVESSGFDNWRNAWTKLVSREQEKVEQEGMPQNMQPMRQMEDTEQDILKEIKHEDGVLRNERRSWSPYENTRDLERRDSLTYRYDGRRTESGRKRKTRRNKQATPCHYFNQRQGCRFDSGKCGYTHFCSICRSNGHGACGCPDVSFVV